MGRRGHRRTGNRRAENPILRALLHTVAARNFPTTGFAPTYKAPPRSWTSPASPPRRTSNATSTPLLNRTGAGRGPATSRWRRHGLPPSSRHLTEALQRLDHLTDLADDLVQGRLYLPQHDLDHCDASRVALQQGDDIPATLNDTPTGEARNGFVPERLSRSAACPPSCGPGWLVPAARALPRAPSDGTGADAVPQRVPPSLPSRRAAGRLSPPRSRQPAAPSNSRL
ncbi:MULTISPECIES: squalene/phytoene synthase family protein [Streptomyces]|uniref:Squalene/phytoene synthase family protein n=1 Tax=Streptomyces bacillaris TaxID=68179 RepID=A0ABW6E1R7_9ACTN